MVKLAPEEFEFVNRYIYAISGIDLDVQKAYLLETRLVGLLRTYGCSSISELCQRGKFDTTDEIQNQIIDAISTNETLFFRDTKPFVLLKQTILPELAARALRRTTPLPPPPIRIWSAACSTGQEPYSIAMILHEMRPSFNGLHAKILGTDISQAATHKARQGRYHQFEMERGLTPQHIDQYFTRQGDRWHLKAAIRDMATFQTLNLMAPFNGLGKFDLILCRNVAIYFNIEDRKKLFEKLAAVLEPHGYLIVGATESLTGISPRFEAHRHLDTIYYQLKR